MILVTGGTGLLGSHLLFDLLSQGYQVKVLSRSLGNRQNVRAVFGYYSPHAADLFNRIDWVEGDVTDLYALSEAFEGVEYVYHTAACVSFDPVKKSEIYRTNVQGTANVVNLCLEKKIKKLCFVSSIASLGTNEDGSPVNEKVLWKTGGNQSDYSVSKFQSEMEVWRGTMEGLNAVIVNPSVIMGPGYWKSGGGAFFPMVANGLRYYTRGTNGYVDVRDVSAAMIAMMDSQISGERFVLSAENISYNDLFAKIALALRMRPPHIAVSPMISNLAWRLEYVRSMCLFQPPRVTKSIMTSAHKMLSYDSSKVKKEIGMVFRSMDESIAEMAALFKKEMAVLGSYGKSS